jgi:hypothetical protein
MNTRWVDFPIYLDGIKRFEAVAPGKLSASEAVERLWFVHDNIEFCFAEGRLIDRDLFDDLESLSEQLKRHEPPALNAIEDLAKRMAARYGFDLPDSEWIKRDDGIDQIWIDQTRIVAESNKRLFGRGAKGESID